MLAASGSSRFKLRYCGTLSQVVVLWYKGAAGTVCGMSSCVQDDKSSWTKPQPSTCPSVLKLYNSLTRSKACYSVLKGIL